MAEVIRMPKMSDTMTEGVIVAWHKKVGDKIKSGDLLAEIETDKAVMEFESFQEGTLLYTGFQQGQAVKVNEVIAVLGNEGEDYKAALEMAGGGNSEVTSEEKSEEKNTKNDRSSNEKKPDAEKSGKNTPQEKQVNEEVKNQQEPQKEKSPDDSPSGAEEKAAAVKSEPARIKASPLAKKIAGDSGVSIEEITGSGEEGRIVKRDVEKFITNAPPKHSEMNGTVGKESFEEVPVSQMRKTIARRLVESKFGAPHFYLTMDIRMDRCIEARILLNELNPDKKISFNDIIIKAAATALRRNPKVNSSFLGDKIRYNHHIHVGMAVAVDEGLLVPVIRFADQKSLSQIADESKSLAEKAKSKKLQPDEMQGNTFTISNLGMMDIDEFTAIINPPDACIMAIGKIKKVPVVINEEIKVGYVLTVTLSCDHRIVDGATGARYLQTFKSFLENPMMMIY